MKTPRVRIHFITRPVSRKAINEKTWIAFLFFYVQIGSCANNGGTCYTHKALRDFGVIDIAVWTLNTIYRSIYLHMYTYETCTFQYVVGEPLLTQERFGTFHWEHCLKEHSIGNIKRVHTSTLTNTHTTNIRCSQLDRNSCCSHVVLFFFSSFFGGGGGG